jgi:hypothetical protein
MMSGKASQTLASTVVSLSQVLELCREVADPGSVMTQKLRTIFHRHAPESDAH